VAAHEQGLVHRDIKPANILLGGGLDQVKITDFGLACVATEPWRLTASGVLLGTPAYMSPEQATLSAVDHRSDLFGLGSVLYHMCTGELPFPGPTLKYTLDGVREAKPRPIRDSNPDIPPALEDVIRRLMAKEPADRYQSAREVVSALTVELAEIQGRGKRPRSVADRQVQASRQAEPYRGHPSGGDFDLPDPLFDEDPPPHTKGTAATAAYAQITLSIARRALPVVGAAMVIAMVVLALISYLPGWYEFGYDTPSILLLAFAGIAVITWSLAQVVTAVRRPTVASPKGPRLVGILRNALAIAILLPTAGTGYRQWSMYFEYRRAVNAVFSRLEHRGPDLLTREAVEGLLGRTAEDLSPGRTPRELKATYRWRGVLRTYALRAMYLRAMVEWH
jgi:hypothetical protein